MPLRPANQNYRPGTPLPSDNQIHTGPAGSSGGDGNDSNGWIARLIPALIALVPLLFFSADFYHYARGTGLYRPDWSGEVISARPTILSVVNLRTRSSRSWTSRAMGDRYRNVGHYAATIRTDDGQILKVGLSYDDYVSTLIPSYLVSKNGRVSHFPSREQALAQHAVEPLRGP